MNTPAAKKTRHDDMLILQESICEELEAALSEAQRLIAAEEQTGEPSTVKGLERLSRRVRQAWYAAGTIADSADPSGAAKKRTAEAAAE